MPGPKDITLTLSLEDYNNLQQAKSAAEQETAAVRKELEIAKGVSGDERVAKVTAFARHCLTLARFAVANCPPTEIKGWPFEVLRKLADTIDVLPDYSLDDRDLAIDLRAFARDCEELELHRRGRDARAVAIPPVDTSAHDA